jgi:hypothetical protein
MGDAKRPGDRVGISGCAAATATVRVPAARRHPGEAAARRRLPPRARPHPHPRRSRRGDNGRRAPERAGGAKRVMATRPRRLRPSGSCPPTHLRHGRAGCASASRRSDHPPTFPVAWHIRKLRRRHRSARRPWPADFVHPEVIARPQQRDGHAADAPARRTGHARMVAGRPALKLWRAIRRYGPRRS